MNACEPYKWTTGDTYFENDHSFDFSIPLEIGMLLMSR